MTQDNIESNNAQDSKKEYSAPELKIAEVHSNTQGTPAGTIESPTTTS